MESGIKSTLYIQPSPIEVEVRRYKEELDMGHRGLAELHKRIIGMQEMQSLVGELPKKMTASAKVSICENAFVKGKIKRTNEFLVLLGENYFVWRTSHQTIEILERRIKELERECKAVSERNDVLMSGIAELEAKGGIDGMEPIVHIMEEYEDDLAEQERHSSDSSDTQFTIDMKPPADDLEKELKALNVLESEEELARLDPGSLYKKTTPKTGTTGGIAKEKKAKTSQRKAIGKSYDFGDIVERM